MKILIVDDEASILDIVEAYLSAKGYQVFRALSGNEALTKVDVVQPDLIVLDLMLPGLSGLEVCVSLGLKHTQPTPIRREDIVFSDPSGEMDNSWAIPLIY